MTKAENIAVSSMDIGRISEGPRLVSNRRDDRSVSWTTILEVNTGRMAGCCSDDHARTNGATKKVPFKGSHVTVMRFEFIHV